MKKISILGLACLAVGSMSAQMQVVKDVEHQLKGDVASYPKAIETLTPAFTNPESANQAQTWYVAGKGALDFVNNAAAMQRVTGELNAPQAAQFVLDGFEYLQKALPLDSVADAKGKIKTKYSKDILKQIVNNYTLTADAGQWFYNDAHDYAKAAEAWTLFINLPKDERSRKPASRLSLIPSSACMSSTPVALTLWPTIPHLPLTASWRLSSWVITRRKPMTTPSLPRLR